MPHPAESLVHPRAGIYVTPQPRNAADGLRQEGMGHTWRMPGYMGVRDGVSLDRHPGCRKSLAAIWPR